MLVVFMVYMALALLASTLARSNGTAVALAFGALVLVGGIGSLPRLSEYFPGRLFAWGSTLVLGARRAPGRPSDSAWG